MRGSGERGLVWDRNVPTLAHAHPPQNAPLKLVSLVKECDDLLHSSNERLGLWGGEPARTLQVTQQVHDGLRVLRHAACYTGQKRSGHRPREIKGPHITGQATLWGNTVNNMYVMCTTVLQKLAAAPPQEASLLGHLFFNIPNVFCAKKRVGHACICPRMVTALDAGKNSTEPQKNTLKNTCFWVGPKTLIFFLPSRIQRLAQNHSKTRVLGLTKHNEKHFYHLGSLLLTG